MQKQELKGFKIKERDLVTVTSMNHITEIQYMQKTNRSCTIKKLNDKEYVLLATGEILEFKEHSPSRTAHISSLYRTMKNLRYLINNNFIGNSNELLLTLTYKENMQDTKRLYKDIDKFMKRLRYKYKDKSTIDYIVVVEPQGRGAWHCHILARFNDLEQADLRIHELKEIWGLGEQVDVKKIDNIDNVGAYLTSYLTDVPLSDLEQEDILKNNLSGSSVKKVDNKMYVKGARLHMYPEGLNIYRTSRGIKKPERKKMTYDKAKEYAGADTLTYSKTIEIALPDSKTNILSYEYYNKKRTKEQD